MLSATVIVFREVLEAALIITIVLAATKGIAGRTRHVIFGIGAGLAGALVIAFFSGGIADLAEGIGQELLNAVILFTAVGLLGWHNVWMGRHAQELADKVAGAARSVAQGDADLHVLSIVVGLAVLREGAEVVLFLYGVSAGGMGSASGMLLGGLMGLAGGLVVGVLLYFGLLMISSRHLFTVTSLLILFLAAGLAAQGAGFLVQAGLIPALVQEVWNSSSLLPQDSLPGQFLHALLGYVERPSGVQLVFYVGTLAVIGGLMRLYAPQNAAKAVAMLIAVGLVFGPSSSTQAGTKVYSPIVEEGAFEIEFKARYDDDPKGGPEDKQVYKLSAGYGVNSFWFTEVVFELEKEGDGSLKYEEFEWENVFQLAPQGKYWIDFGLFVEAEIPNDDSKPSSLVIGPLLQKEIGQTVHILDILFERKFGNGSGSGVELDYFLESRYRLHPKFEPGIWAFGGFGKIGNFDDRRDQPHRIGPMVMGKLPAGRMSHFKYAFGVLFGLTHAAPDFSVNWRIEWETYF